MQWQGVRGHLRWSWKEGREELEASRAGNDRLGDLDVDVADIALYKKFLALGGHDDAVIARERCRHHANSENDGGRILSTLPDADDVSASPLHLPSPEGHGA